MDFTRSSATQRRVADLEAFMDTHVLPQNATFQHQTEQGVFPLEVIEPLKAKARARGLWNLFLPSLDEDAPGQRLTNLEYVPLAEIMGRVPWSSEVFNCSPPDAVNMEILSLFASPKQRAELLEPLLEGTIRSSVAMSERDVPGSDMTGSQTTITREGDELVLNGRKWFVNGALHPNFSFVTVFGRQTDAEGSDSERRHSWVVVPNDTPGFTIERHLPIMGQPWPQGYCEVRFDNARVPAANLLGEPGGGLGVAQALMGPALVHHCARTIGQCEFALELLCDRAVSREVSGLALADRANIRDWVAESRIGIEQTRLLVLKAAWLMDAHGNAAASTAISTAKVAAARMQTSVVDRAIQVFGALGLTPDTPLAYLWTWGRALRIIDGPDEAHLEAIARQELDRERPRAATALTGSGSS